MREWPEGYARRVLPEVDSTNAEAARIASDLAGPTWILGLRQTAGHGRRGRVWTHPEGNFAGSLVMRPAAQASEMAKRSFVAALALHDALSDVTGQGARFSLKWPNDILLNGGKVAGILLESAGGPGGIISHIAIGMGVNLAAAPDVGEVEAWATRPVSLLSETGVLVSPEEFLNVLAPNFAHWETQIATYGFEPIRAAWLSRAAKIGEVITARTMREEWSGTFETVDNEGNLVLNTPKGAVAIPAADVFF
ncbi:biotin--[acetyl-CoA-carboxylase] ligase [Cognatishimia sp.]|uniref:biotin--[acetyl-CoA-carboxylase] ligase n=1 Tax=Cognatishimia sp. TaxID=2211648 RepID=UPI0035161710